MSFSPKSWKSQVSYLRDDTGDLCRFHRLRAYDAVQLACALEVRNKLAALGILAPTFVSADTELLNIAKAEGLIIENPSVYP
jgi:predicted nucleic acid-binding protein